jgi:hypothetical protein
VNIPLKPKKKGKESNRQEMNERTEIKQGGKKRKHKNIIYEMNERKYM